MTEQIGSKLNFDKPTKAEEIYTSSIERLKDSIQTSLGLVSIDKLIIKSPSGMEYIHLGSVKSVLNINDRVFLAETAIKNGIIGTGQKRHIQFKHLFIAIFFQQILDEVSATSENIVTTRRDDFRTTVNREVKQPRITQRVLDAVHDKLDQISNSEVFTRISAAKAPENQDWDEVEA